VGRGGTRQKRRFRQAGRIDCSTGTLESRLGAMWVWGVGEKEKTASKKRRHTGERELKETAHSQLQGPYQAITAGGECTNNSYFTGNLAPGSGTKKRPPVRPAGTYDLPTSPDKVKKDYISQVQKGAGKKVFYIKREKRPPLPSWNEGGEKSYSIL